MTEAIQLVGLANKDLFRVDEVAAYFSVEDRTIRLWIQHGHLESEKLASGTIRITKKSILKCRMGGDTRIKSQTIGIVGKPVVKPEVVAEKIATEPEPEIDPETKKEVKVEGTIKKRAGRPAKK